MWGQSHRIHKLTITTKPVERFFLYNRLPKTGLEVFFFKFPVFGNAEGIGKRREVKGERVEIFRVGFSKNTTRTLTLSQWNGDSKSRALI